ncbi:hypothetical protein JKF63_06080 [Porcisia hertigi]|uniref:Uncharacterized protein n=1 Tax=Porcisia hertigi TaxID=2761500 RepID=A0A836IMR3_9TRYP|nr:hypothetical protein JKF63_06080 [Porcisia hertigi]
MSHDFRTLFLPLAANERAVFADVFLAPNAAHVPSQGTAVGERTSQPPLRTVPETRNSLSKASRFSLAEAGRHLEAAGEDATDLSSRPSAPLCPMLFAVGSARADTVIAVLRTGDIVLYGLDRPSTPPYEKYRIRPFPTTQQLATAREKGRHHIHADDAASAARQQHSSGSADLGNSDDICGDGTEATCAALLPLHIAYCCRIPIPAPFSTTTAATSRSSPGPPGEETDEDAVYLRGIVGSSDGRVSLFTTTSYTLSFAAHEVSVAQVDAVLLPPCTVDGYVSANMSCTTTTTSPMHRVNSTVAFSNRAAAAAAGESTPTTCLHPKDCLARATQRLGLITSGSDGVVLLWRHLRGAMSPIVVVRPSIFYSRVAYTVHHPIAIPTLLSVWTPASQREAAMDAELSCPPSIFLHAATSLSHRLCVRQFASLSPKPLHKSLYSVGDPESLEAAAPISMSTTLQGPWSATMTAIATHRSITLVAMGVSLVSLVHFDARTATRVWKAEDIITQVVLSDSVALAVCARSGTVHVLTIHTRTGQAEHRCVYRSYNNRAILHASLHAASLLMTIVDVCGSTELVQLSADVLVPSQVQPLDGDCMSGDPADVCILASMATLRAKVCIENIKSGGCGGASTANGSALPSCTTLSMHEVNAACDQLNERLLLARYAVPEECDRFLSANVHVL